MLLATCFLLIPGQLGAQVPADFPEALQVRALTATVRVSNPGKKIEGSGVIVGRTGTFVYVLTAHHVVAGADGVEISVFAEKNDAKAHKVYRNGRVVAKSADLRDLALVRVLADDKLLPNLPICPVEGMPKEDVVSTLATGCSAGQGPTAIVHDAVGKKKVRKKADAESAYFWETAGTVAKGRSGGPLVDKRGFVIGICSGTSDGAGYYTHIQEIHHFLKENVFDWLADKEAGGPR